MQYRSTQLREERAAVISQMEGIVTAASDEARELTDEERAQFDELESRVDVLDGDIRRAEKLEGFAPASEARAAVVTPGGDPTVKSEALTYEYRNRNASFLSDVFRAQMKGDHAARERLDRHMAEVREIKPDALEVRAQSTTDGAGGEFVPPIWLLDQYEKVARAGRPFADIWSSKPLPLIGDFVDIPTLVTGSTAATQTEGSAVSNTDPTTSSIQSHVYTIAGEITVNRQVLDRGQGMDQVYFEDLLGAYAVALDTKLISSNASNEKGVLNVSGINARTFTAGTATPAGLYAAIAGAKSDVDTNLNEAANVVVMHGRRWMWFVGQVDGSNRPLVVPNNNGAMNAAALLEGGATGPVGTIFGNVPVVVDNNIPTNLGAGTDEDRIIVATRRVLELREEAAPRLEVDPYSAGSNLQTKLRLYSYNAHGVRNAKGVTVISGTGLNDVL
jgi:HK97 family phage major capsid protein